MPASVVKTKEDERLWNKAKGLAKEQGKAENWAYIQGIFQKMKTANVVSQRYVDTVSLQEGMCDLIAKLDTLHWQLWTAHWQAAGPTSYSDHMLYGRLYGEVYGEIDPVAEKIVGRFGPSAVDPNVTSNPNSGLRPQGSLVSLPVLLENEQIILEALDVLTLKAGDDNALQDLFQGMSSTHDTHCYLLRQRLN